MDKHGRSQGLTDCKWVSYVRCSCHGQFDSHQHAIARPGQLCWTRPNIRGNVSVFPGADSWILFCVGGSGSFVTSPGLKPIATDGRKLLYYTILDYTIPCDTISYYTIPCYTILCDTIPYYTILYHTIKVAFYTCVALLSVKP